jgi:hypothetical protein
VGLPVDARLEAYTLVCLVAHGPFQLSREEMNALYAVIRSGSTVLMEACHGDSPAANAALAGIFNDLAGSFGIPLAEAQPGQALLTEPNLFGAVPPGYETEGAPRLLVGDGLIVSLNDYGCLWQGQRRGRPAAREEIRSAQEWGENLIHFALTRKQERPAR